MTGEAKTIRVTEVKPLDGFSLQLRFNDGAERVVDLADELWSPVFEPLKADPDLFRQVRVDEEMGTIVGPTGPTWTPTCCAALTSRPEALAAGSQLLLPARAGHTAGDDRHARQGASDPKRHRRRGAREAA